MLYNTSLKLLVFQCSDPEATLKAWAKAESYRSLLRSLAEATAHGLAGATCRGCGCDGATTLQQVSQCSPHFWQTSLFGSTHNLAVLYVLAR